MNKKKSTTEDNNKKKIEREMKRQWEEDPYRFCYNPYDLWVKDLWEKDPDQPEE